MIQYGRMKRAARRRKRLLRRLLCGMLALLLCCCAGHAWAEDWDEFVVDENDEDLPPDYRYQARVLMRGMTDEQKICQLFFVCPEDLTGEKRTSAWPESNLLSRYPVGGVVLFGQNMETEEQVRGLIGAIRDQAAAAKIYPPFIAVHEEGGGVSRAANKLGYEFAPSPAEIGQTGDGEMAYAAGLRIGGYLSALGVNVDFAPAADVKVIEDSEAGDRTYSDDPALVSRMAERMAAGLTDGGVIPCYVHFPGLGGAPKRNYEGVSSLRRQLAEMAAVEWTPFRDAIDRDEAAMIMVGNVTVRAVGDDVPASVSGRVINGLLRGQLGYDGVVVTESLRMNAVVSAFKTGRECVEALKAGADLLLLPKDFSASLQAVRQAVQSGEISMERIEESVERILALKIRSGMIR